MFRLNAHRRPLTSALIAIALLFACPAHSNAPRPHYILAVVPYDLALSAYKEWAPVVERLSDQLGIDIEIRVYRTFAAFETELFQGKPDLAFVNPYHQLVAHRRHRYIPLVRSSEALKGILVVSVDSPVKSTRELEGSIVAFPSPNAFAASLYMRALLAEREHVRVTPHYLDSHNEVYRHVILDQARAGGSTRASLANERPQIREQLRILYETPPMVPHALTAHPRVPAPVREGLIRAVLDLAKKPEGQERLVRIQLGSPQAADQQRDYQPLEQLHLDKYAVMAP